MENIEADICIKNLRNLVQKHRNSDGLSESCRNSMIEAYNSVTRENACGLYSNISSQINMEFSLINKNYNLRQIKYSGITLTGGLMLYAISHLISKYTKQKPSLLNGIGVCTGGIGICATVIGFCWFLSIGH
ncbi:Hypothetical protein HVR_LOCUS387 [uncultured virus]|nr:Hypothetical protein HVR_LOCUS387 [uncultured virus]